MEDTLRVFVFSQSNNKNQVLILVLMEDTLREVQVFEISPDEESLNPCFNGRYSQRSYVRKYNYIFNVLILVLMEDTLRGTISTWKSADSGVLILVLMEDTLRVREKLDGQMDKCLNPCFNGRYSQRR